MRAAWWRRTRYDEVGRNTGMPANTGDPSGTLLCYTRLRHSHKRQRALVSVANHRHRRLPYKRSCAYDVSGRPTSQAQQFYVSGAWSSSYVTSRAYNLPGGVTSITYPSGHTVNYNYDQAGSTRRQRLIKSRLTGNLGDGTLRPYSAGIRGMPR